MQILVTGAAGYIGSHVVKQLIKETNYEIVIIDNLSTGFMSTIETLKSLDTKNCRIKFYEQDLSQFDKIEEIFKNNDIKEIIHFAAFSQVAESITNPLKYYTNNTANTASLIKLAVKYHIKKFIFSSTAAVYGEPTQNEIPITESLQTKPINPYGNSKLFSEKIIQDTAHINKDFKFVILRYFNVCGADVDGKLGENHDPETHLTPLIAKTALGKRDSISIYGNDYETDDGTCIRDYIHVNDLADAHIKALHYLDTNSSDIFNCGYGCGYSVNNLINMMKKVSGVDFNVNIAPRREGDPAILIANCTKIMTKMKWVPKYDNLEFICTTSLNWEKSLN